MYAVTDFVFACFLTGYDAGCNSLAKNLVSIGTLFFSLV